MVLAMLFCVGLAAAVCGEEPAADDPPVDTALLDELRRLEQKRGPIEDLSARFTQERSTPLLRKPIRSEGVVRFKGPVMRWEVTGETPSVVHRSESELHIYLPQDNTVEIYPIAGRARFMWGSGVMDIAAIVAGHRIERLEGDAGEIALRLTPRDASTREHLDHLDLTIDATTGLVTTVRMFEGDANTTLIRFEDVRINTGLTDQDVALILPADVKVSRPLGEDQDEDS